MVGFHLQRVSGWWKDAGKRLANTSGSRGEELEVSPAGYARYCVGASFVFRTEDGEVLPVRAGQIEVVTRLIRPLFSKRESRGLSCIKINFSGGCFNDSF